MENCGQGLDKSRATATTTIFSLNLCGKKITGDRCMAEVANHHFTTVRPKLAAQIKILPSDDPLKNIINEPSARVKFQPVSNSQVLQYLRNLKPGMSSGPCNLPTKLVKDAAEYIPQPLRQIFNSSLTSRVFPDIWKVARVAPIFKAGTSDDLNNYRPISVLCTISKVFEKIVHDQVVIYLVEQRILVQNQYAHRKLHSTITSLIKSADDWLSSIDSRKVNLTLFLDVKKAFDTVDHKILLDKLGAYGVKGTEFKWFKSYLSKRRQFCRVNGYNSKTMRVTCVIPQGSCLGPLLFTLYLNDFENCLQYSSASMYAYDTH